MENFLKSIDQQFFNEDYCELFIVALNFKKSKFHKIQHPHACHSLHQHTKHFSQI